MACSYYLTTRLNRKYADKAFKYNVTTYKLCCSADFNETLQRLIIDFTQMYLTYFQRTKKDAIQMRFEKYKKKYNKRKANMHEMQKE